MRLKSDNNIGMLPQPTTESSKTRPKVDTAYQPSNGRGESAFADMLTNDEASESRSSRSEESPKRSASSVPAKETERIEQKGNKNRSAEAPQKPMSGHKPAPKAQADQPDETRSAPVAQQPQGAQSSREPAKEANVGSSQATAPQESGKAEQSSAVTANEVQNSAKALTTGKPISMAELKAIRQNLADQGLLNEQLPVLSLIGGRVDQLDPVQIPELMGNEFLANALTVPEVKKYLETPRSMQGLLNEMDAGREILQVLEHAGVDVSSLVTPRQIIDALGVDPNRALSEINQLRQSMKDSPDLSIYMAIAAKGKIHASNAGGPAQKNVSDDPTSPGAVASAWDKNRSSDENATIAKNPHQSANVGAAVGQSVVGAPQQAPVNQKPSMRSATTDSGSKGREAAPLAMNAKTVGNEDALVSSNLVSESKLDVQAATTPAASNGLRTEAEQLTSQELGAADSRPTAKIVEHDPFESMRVMPVERDTTILRTTEVRSDVKSPLATSQHDTGDIRTDQPSFQIGSTNTSYKDVVLAETATPITAMMNAEYAKSMRSVSTTQLRMLDAAVDLKASMDQEVITEDKSDVAADSASQRAPLATEMMGAVLPAEGEHAKLSTEAESNKVDISKMDVLGFEAVGAANSSQTKQEFGSNGFDDREDKSSTETSPDAVIGQIGVGHTASEFKATLQDQAPAVNEAKNAEHLEKVFEKAEMMVKNGGGSIKLEIGGEGNEKVEIAVRVFGDKVDLKITTANDQLRDMLNSGVPKLRESFANRNLLLEQVNVGVNAGQSWENSSQQNFERWQQARDTMNEAASSSSYGSVRSESTMPIRPYRSWGGQLRHHTGQIQVAV